MRRDVLHYDMHSFRLYTVCDTIIRAKENFVEHDVNLRGQDMSVSTHRNSAPPARRRPAERTTEQVKLNLSPADAAAIRIAAKLLDMTHSEYVAKLVSVAGDPTKLVREQDRVVDASRIAGTLSQVPGEVRRLRADLGRLAGMLQSFFIREDSDQLLADRLASECASTLQAVITATEKSDAVFDALQENLAGVRDDLDLAVQQLVGR
jgi:hypothetical protein